MRIKHLLVLLYTGYAGIVFIIFMFLSTPLIIIPLLFQLHGNSLSYTGLRFWAQGFRYLSGIRYEIRGQEHLSNHQSYIFTLNHTSYLDAPALPLIAHHAFKPLAKKELGRIPVFGSLIRVITVMVDRSNAANRKESVLRLTHAIRSGTSLIVFPEGTINKTAAPLAPFYDGAFRIALETQTPIVPVIIHGASRLMPPGRLCMKPGKISIEILSPVTPGSFTPEQAGALKETVFRKMENALSGQQQGSEEKSIKKDTAFAVPFVETE